MSAAKFTKAPWRVSHMCQGRGAVGADHRRSVAEVWALDDDVPQEEMEANANLVAASPMLYEALEDVHKLICAGAEHGFNPMKGDWAEKLFRSNRKTSEALKAARGEK